MKQHKGKKKYWEALSGENDDNEDVARLTAYVSIHVCVCVREREILRERKRKSCNVPASRTSSLQQRMP